MTPTEHEKQQLKSIGIVVQSINVLPEINHRPLVCVYSHPLSGVRRSMVVVNGESEVYQLSQDIRPRDESAGSPALQSANISKDILLLYL